MVTAVKVGNLITLITFKKSILADGFSTVKKAFYIQMISASVFIAKYLIQ